VSGSEELEIRAHAENVARLKERIARAARQLMRFVVEMALAVILALLVVLPHALRALAILAWIAGMGATLAAAWTLYSAISPSRERIPEMDARSCREGSRRQWQALRHAG